MKRKEFLIIEEDGIVVYDESDDYFPEDDENVEDDVEVDEDDDPKTVQIPENENLDSPRFVPCGDIEIEYDKDLNMEYMIEYWKQQMAREAAEKSKQRWISAGVIAAIILYVGGICYFKFKGILF